MGSLSDVQVKNLKPGKKSYKKFDGDGLFIEVRPTGRKTWFQKYSIVRIVDGVEKRVVDEFRIGKYPAISLKKAREISQEIQAKIAQGIDPKVELRNNLEEAKKQEEIEGLTFRVIRKEWWKKWKLTKAVDTQENWKRHLQHFMNDFDYKPTVTIY